MTMHVIMFMTLLCVSVVHLSTCLAVEVEYSKKIVSDREGDEFGYSLATSHHKLVIGAPWYNGRRGSVVVDEGVRVERPADGWMFGDNVDVNQQFMVVNVYHPNSVYVYQSHSPYNMVARLPMDDHVMSLVISDDNTIAVCHNDYNNCCYSLTIYQYDGSSTWNIVKKFKLKRRGIGAALAVYGDIIVVGVPRASHKQGHVHIFNRIHREWEQGQTIKEDDVGGFGSSVAIYGKHMAVSTASSYVFTYMLDQHTNTWINNGKHSVPSDETFVSIQNDLMVATINDMMNHSDECGIVYKLTATTSNNNNNNNNNNDSVAKTSKNNWKEIARLTTKGDLMTSEYQHHEAVSIQNHMIFTGRYDDLYGDGKVFVHDLSKCNN